VADVLTSTMAALAGLVAGLEPDERRMRAAAAEGETTAVDLAEALVRAGVPFREAHAAVGAAVRLAAGRGARLADLDDRELLAIHPALVQVDRAVLDVDGSLAAKATPGSTNPGRVAEQLEILEERAAAARAWAADHRPHLDLGTG
jgi:argininosuccinate lyase